LANDEVEIETQNKRETRRGNNLNGLVMVDGDDGKEAGGGNSRDNSLVQLTIMVKGTSGK